MTVNLKEVVDWVDGMPHDWKAWVDRETGELLSLGEFDPDPDEADRVATLEKQGRLVWLPTVQELPEWHVVERFVGSLDDEEAVERLGRAFQGRGRWRALKNELMRLELRDAYDAFRWEAVRREIEMTLQSEGIEYR